MRACSETKVVFCLPSAVRVTAVLRPAYYSFFCGWLSVFVSRRPHVRPRACDTNKAFMLYKALTRF